MFQLSAENLYSQPGTPEAGPAPSNNGIVMTIVAYMNIMLLFN